MRLILALAAGMAVASGCGGSSHVATLAAPDTVAGVLAIGPAPPPPTATPAPEPPVPTEEPPPIGTGTAVLVGAGDIGECGSAGIALTSRVIQGIDGQVLLAGDMGYPGKNADDLKRCFEPEFGRFKSRWRPVPGNHEYEAPNAHYYFDYFSAAAGPDRRGYYAFRAASWLVVMLNSNVPTRRGSPQYDWLEDHLRTERARCTLAVWHHPFATSGPNGPSNFMRDIWQLLMARGADVVVNGHDHLYERFAPQDEDYRLDADRGLRQFIVGTGGATLYRPITRAPNSEIVLTNFGVLKLTLQPGYFEWDYIDANTRTSADRGQAVCR